jgi:hypothetical protein
LKNFLKEKTRLKIHCWGGFGSQLNCLGFALELHQKYPNKKLELFFHSSGVTRREIEIHDLIPSFFDYYFIDDFSDKNFFGGHKSRFKQFVNHLLALTNIIVYPTCNEDLVKIKFWTLSSRGHYSYFVFSDKVLSDLAIKLGVLEEHVITYPQVIHYRLGDLLEIEKGHVAAEQVLSLLGEMQMSKWLVLTDSPAEAKSLLEFNNYCLQFIDFLSVKPKDVLRAGFACRVFVGTNSKLSIWVAILRLRFNRGETFLPLTLERTIRQLVNEKKASMLHFY